MRVCKRDVQVEHQLWMVLLTGDELCTISTVVNWSDFMQLDKIYCSASH